MVKKAALVVAMGLLLGGLAAACAPAAKTIPVGERVFYLTVHEPRGGQTIDKLAEPPVDPSTLSKGYAYYKAGFDPARPTRWDVEAYLFSPSAMAVYQKDQVTLKIFAVNGDNHATYVEGPDGKRVMVKVSVTGVPGEQAVTEFNVQRGRETVVSFSADQKGVYRLVCDTHAPSMVANILALPR